MFAEIVRRFHVNLTDRSVRFEEVPCEDLEDRLGGIARSFKLLAGSDVTDPYTPDAPLVMNLGRLSGTRVMTGLRTFFTGYSPLKTSDSGRPGLMWSAGSGHFGPKLRGLGIDDVVFTGRADGPVLLHITPGDEGEPARFDFLPASDLVGRKVNDRMQDLHRRWPEAHVAAIGTAGEHYELVRYAAIALSTDNQWESGDMKARFCGRGGYGGVMGSKNLLAIIADGPDPGRQRGLRDINKEINLGPGSQRYRDLPDDRGGTWRTMKLMWENGSLPELNFAPTGTEAAKPLLRPSVEEGPYIVNAEGCYLCGIKCHKNVYDETADGEAGRFRAKVDYEPGTLLSSNLGIYDPDAGFDFIEMSDEYGMDAISLGVTLGYAMEWNRRNPDRPIAGGLSYGDVEATRGAVAAIGTGDFGELGQGTKRLAEAAGDTAFAMHGKGLEYPAYQPHTNPGYPWALAGGHMSMRTFFNLVLDRETDMDYWVDAITNKGWVYLLDDITGLCKFTNASLAFEAEALALGGGIEVTPDELKAAVERTFLRGYADERAGGFEPEDYRLPADAHLPMETSDLPYFLTEEFFTDLREQVTATFDERAAALGYL